MHEIGIESSTLELIRQGEKTIEGRLGKPKFLKIKPGDTIKLREDVWIDGQIVESRESDVIIHVTQVLYFESFAEMLESLDFKAVIPKAETVSEAIEKYRTFYTEQDEYEFGVVAILFELK